MSAARQKQFGLFFLSFFLLAEVEQSQRLPGLVNLPRDATPVSFVGANDCEVAEAALAYRTSNLFTLFVSRGHTFFSWFS